MLKRAIKLHNNKIEIDYNRLESLKNYEFYENLRSSGYAKYLNDMYLMGILKFDKNKNPLFLDYAELNANDNKLKPRISGWANADISKCKVWVIAKWYWFGRWELHFNNYLTNVLIDLGNDISLILNILYSFPEALPILGPLSLYLSAATWLISNANSGDGVYINFYLLIPIGIYGN